MPGVAPKPPEADASEIRRAEVGVSAAGLRLDKALSAAFADLSRSRLQGLIEEGAVSLNGQPAKASARVRLGDRLEVRVPAPRASDLEAEAQALSILYEDSDLLVVAKAAGVVVHPGAGAARGTLAAALLAHCGTLSTIGGVTRPGIVHRLDKGTSGLLVVAKNDATHRALATQFKNREVEKRYAAVCVGEPRPARGSARGPIGRDPKHRKRMAIVPTGRAAHTDYEVVEGFGAAAALSLRLHTGRTHQIRVHMASLGCPLVGDRTYGASGLAARAPAAFRSILEGFPRPALHAEGLAFTHPATGERLQFTEPWPPDLAELRSALRLTAAATGTRKMR